MILPDCTNTKLVANFSRNRSYTLNQPNVLKYLQGYPRPVLAQVSQLISTGKLTDWVKSIYPEYHQIRTDKLLLEYTMGFKNQYLKKSPPLNKVVYDNKIHIVNNALGLHSYVLRVQGKKLKAKNEIRIAELFRNAPSPLIARCTPQPLGNSARAWLHGSPPPFP